MQKIISLFERNFHGDRLVRDEIVSGAEWVADGEGIATRKWDGTACLVRDKQLWKRYDAKRGKAPPPDFQPAQEADDVTGHWPGWVPVTDRDPANAWHLVAWYRSLAECLPLLDGTYELCGPHFQGNPEGFLCDLFLRHGKMPVDAPRTFAALRDWFAVHEIEGIVWHHSDGRMVKIKRTDFGLPWPVKGDSA